MKRSSQGRCLPLRAALVAGALVSALVLGAEPSLGQSGPDMTAVYGRGIHAYFANRTSQADAYFTQVINAGSQDPRVFYFRAMARLRAGRQYEAQQDMQLGAMFEARDPGASGSIGQALTRIQGRNRQMLEQYRRQARLLHSEDQASLAQARYQEQRRQETEVLRQETPLDLGSLAGGGSSSVAPPEAAATPQPELTEAPALPAVEADAVDPFGAGFGDEPPADVDAGSAFDVPASEPAVADEPAFPAADDPFGNVPADDPTAGAEEPFGNPPPAGDDADDPFSLGDPAADATAPAESTAAEGQHGEEGNVLGRIFGHALSDMMPSLPTTLPGMGESDEAATAPPAEAFDFGPGDAPAADGQAPRADEDDAGFDADDPFNLPADDPFSFGGDDPLSEPPTAERPPAATDEPAAGDAGDPFSDPFGSDDGGDPFAPVADDSAADDEETEAPTEESATDDGTSGGTLEEDPFGGR